VLILLAEDESLIALSIEEALQEGGFAVLSAESGEEAVAAIDTDSHLFVGLITDVRLGAGPDGWDVARRAREVYPNIAVVYMSGDSAAEHRSRGVPGSLMVQKPFATAQIVNAIAALLDPPAT
jgi:DNA-binding response OmpR family regulator